MSRDPEATESAEPSEDWYATGLRFDCHGCGACCRGEGYVWVDRPTRRRIAKHLGLTVDEFGSRYLRRVGRRYSLTEKKNHDCVFWEEGCNIYEMRPTQCRTFPFWPENIATESRWTEAAKTCGGMGCGRLYEIGEIQMLSAGRGETNTEATPDDHGGATNKCP